MRVQGGGHVHATHVSIAAGRLTVDDLGTITGDLHTIPCTVGQGKDGISGSGNLKLYTVCYFHFHYKT